jgi:hypothetical protein
MFGLTIQQLLFSMAAISFSAGLLTFWIGVFVLISRSTSSEVRAIANQTAQIAKKGLANDLAGLVGNASSLIAVMNDLIRTQNGIGGFLIVVGVILMITSAGLALYLFVNQ